MFYITGLFISFICYVVALTVIWYNHNDITRTMLFLATILTLCSWAGVLIFLIFSAVILWDQLDLTYKIIKFFDNVVIKRRKED